MKKISIKVSVRGRLFVSNFESDAPEYAIADEAYRLALMYAHTQILADYGHPLSSHEFGKYLEEVDYDYTIAEEKV